MSEAVLSPSESIWFVFALFVTLFGFYVACRMLVALEDIRDKLQKEMEG